MGAYERGGAAAISVLTDEPHFHGSLADLEAARAASALPILRKDFVVDPYQLWEASLAGADAVLLIAAALAEEDLQLLWDEATAIDLDCLVEVHDEADLERALRLDPDDVDANFNLAVAYESGGWKEQAAASYRRVLAVAPAHVGAHNNLAVLLAESGRMREAIPHFEAVLRARPDDPDARRNLERARRAP